MKKYQRLISIILSLALIIITMVGCRRKVITYPDATYSDIYSDVVISNSDVEDNDDFDDVISEDTVTSEVSSSVESEIEEEYDYGGIDIKGGRAFNVSDYGAKGDGKTDDCEAVHNAIQAAIRYTLDHSGKKAEVKFEKNKSYLLQNKSDNMNSGTGVLQIFEANNISLIGENTTIIGTPNDCYLRVQKSDNILIKGLNFTYDTPVAYTAKIIGHDNGGAVFNVPKWFADCVRKYKNFGEYDFAIAADGYRNHLYMPVENRYEMLDETRCKIPFGATEGTEIYMPTPGYSHIGIAFQVLHNTGTVTFEDINIWNAANFVFQVNSNFGQINYKNVKLAPKDENSSATVAWRDVIHAKDNRKKLTFDKCVFKGTHDDIFNISNTMCQVAEIGEDNEIMFVGLDYANGDYAQVYEGDTVVAIDPYIGKYFGEAKVVSVSYNAKGKFIKLDRDLGLEGGEYIYFKELASPGTTMKDCIFDGSYRIKGSSIIENCDFTVVAMWSSYSGQNSRTEGPIPSDIIYRNCSFKQPKNTAETTRIGFGCSTIGGEGVGLGTNTEFEEYHVKNIIFENCKFAYPDILERTNPYVIIR